MLACRKEGFIMIFWIFRGSTETISRNSVSVRVCTSLIWEQPVVPCILLQSVRWGCCMEDSFSWICLRFGFYCSLIPLVWGVLCWVLPDFGCCVWLWVKKLFQAAPHPWLPAQAPWLMMVTLWAPSKRKRKEKQDKHLFTVAAKSRCCVQCVTPMCHWSMAALTEPRLRGQTLISAGLLWDRHPQSRDSAPGSAGLGWLKVMAVAPPSPFTGGILFPRICWLGQSPAHSGEAAEPQIPVNTFWKALKNFCLSHNTQKFSGLLSPL